MCKYQTTMSIYIPLMNSLQSTMSPQVLVYIHFTLLAYASEHIYLSHQKFMSHCTGNIVYMKTPQYCATMNWNFMYHALSIYMPLKCHIYATYTNYFMCIYETTMLVYLSDMNSTQWIWAWSLICIHSTLLAYAPEEICLPHCTYLSYCTSIVDYV